MPRQKEEGKWSKAQAEEAWDKLPLPFQPKMKYALELYIPSAEFTPKPCHPPLGLVLLYPSLNLSLARVRFLLFQALNTRHMTP